MKIAIFHELHPGGARRSVNEFGQRLKKKHHIDLYFVDEKLNPKERNFFHKIHFYKFIPKKWSGGDWKAKLYKDTIELHQIEKLHKKIAKEIDANNYDLVFIDPSKFTQAPYILKYLKTPKIYYCQEPLRMVYEPILGIKKDLPPHKYLYEKLNRARRKKIDHENIHAADVIIANSKYTKSNIKRAYGLESLYSYMGVEPKVFRPVKVKKDIDILFIGSYDVADGYDVLEKASQYLKGQKVIKVLAAEKQWITDDKMMRELYCRAKVAVALMYNEPFGLIPLEAMACGIPVIAVNDGGYKETIKDQETGYLIKRDPKILAEKLNSLLSSPKRLEKMGQTARKYIEEQWTWDLGVKSLEKIFQDTLKK